MLAQHIKSLPSVQHLSFVLTCTSRQGHVTSLSSTRHHLPIALPCIWSRWPQCSTISPSCYQAHHLAALGTASFNRAIIMPVISLTIITASVFRVSIHIISLSSEHNLSIVLPCTSSRCPQHNILPCAIMHIISRPHQEKVNQFCATMHISSLFSIKHPSIVLPYA